MMNLARLAFAFLILSGSLALAADDDHWLGISMHHSPLADYAILYNELTGKNVEYSPRELATLTTPLIDLDTTNLATCGGRFSKARAVRLVESVLYLKGFEIKPKDATTVVFTRWATFVDHAPNERAPSGAPVPGKIVDPVHLDINSFSQTPGATPSNSLRGKPVNIP